MKYFLIAGLALLFGCRAVHTTDTSSDVDAGDAGVPDTSTDLPDPLLWISLPEGSYDMGSEEVGDEKPIHEVHVSGFAMLKTEVTVGQYQICVAASACEEPLKCGKYTTWEKSLDLPVNCVTVLQARDFCAFAYGRLPTEAEWEYAAKSGGADNRFPWGDAAADCTVAVMSASGDAETDWGCGEGDVLPVCSKPVGNTDQGLCDMAGNLWEWVEDDYHDDYTDAPSDSSAWMSEDSPGTVVRGGCFYDQEAGLRCTERALSIDQGADIGFRCVK